jgi:protein transport protein SEC61 subunit gamma-like protein
MGFIEEAIRVLRLTRKPNKEEFLLVAKVTGAGMIVIGVIGTLIAVTAKLIGLE